MQLYAVRIELKGNLNFSAYDDFPYFDHSYKHTRVDNSIKSIYNNISLLEYIKKNK